MLQKSLEQEAAMQSEALETAESHYSVKMTFSDSNKAPSPKLATQPPTDDPNMDFFPFETKHNPEINLEDDIEKVEISSVDSSDQDTPETSTPPFPEQNSNESIKNWLQKITVLQKRLNAETSSLNLDYNELAPRQPPQQQQQQQQQQQSSSRVVKFQDLPYMGEMTLANSKPRRGRKPKKADICHLIYKNYGTILPGTPSSKNYMEKEASNKKDMVDEDDSFAYKSNVQNKIISSLLEKRLTQEIKKTITDTKKNPSASSKCSGDQNEPLNLCIRDLNHLKIRLLKKTDNTYTSEMKSKSQSDEDVEFVRDSSASPAASSTTQRFPFDPLTTSSPDLSQIPENGYVYWPNAGVFIHPVALQQHLMYYQRMVNNNSYTLPSHSPRPPPETPTKKVAVRKEKKVDVTDDIDKPAPELKSKRNASSASDKTPTKRKRSAIFIPPIPTENNTNPATEVSICKFKFTGGAKPSLQEKKMLSVDSGGNFRYYSGTGDKSMRGYEFFPRETLQQQINNAHGSSTGAFLQASGEKIYPVAPLDFAANNKSSPEFLLSTPEIPSPSMQELTTRHKKRKSRKSLQREKLEQTFKEKGFLIQTQQLESAEGATYCKFRQLRKFTRYLFRSWKDYLPGNVRELQEGEKVEESDDVVDQDIDNLSRHSSDVGGSNAQF